jgi:hypothetical protein
MAIILDADLVIRGEKGAFDLERWVASRPHDRFEIAAIAVAELWHGVVIFRGLLQTRFIHRYGLYRGIFLSESSGQLFIFSQTFLFRVSPIRRRSLGYSFECLCAWR